MSDASIEIKSKSLYTITVNGIPDLIKLDITDVSLPAKYLDIKQKVQERLEQFDKEVEEICKHEDKEFESGITQNYLDGLNALNEMCNDLREQVDRFLGKGVCQAIFGDVNTYNMFNDLFTAINPELEKAFKKGNMSLEGMRKGLIEKYKPQDESVLK